jgi:hypothetical protein
MPQGNPSALTLSDNGFSGPTVNIPMDGTPYTVTLAPVVGPPYWLDTAGNVIAPGLYSVDVIINVQNSPTTPGKFVYWNTYGELWEADGMVIFGAVIGRVTVVLTQADLPFDPSTQITGQTDATGSLQAFTFVQQLLAS